MKHTLAVKRLKKQLRRGGWHIEARNLEKKVEKQGLPVTIPTLNGYLKVKYDMVSIVLERPSLNRLTATLWPEGRAVADESNMLYMKPRVVHGSIPLYEDGVMKGYSIRLPQSLRQRVTSAYPGESLGTVIRDVLATHLKAIGR